MRPVCGPVIHFKDPRLPLLFNTHAVVRNDDSVTLAILIKVYMNKRLWFCEVGVLDAVADKVMQHYLHPLAVASDYGLSSHGILE